jgi:hypothetical protein
MVFNLGQLFDAHFEELHPPFHGFHECEVKVLAIDGQGNPRKTSPCSQVSNSAPYWNELGHAEAVEDVSFPESLSLSRPNQTPGGSLIFEKFLISLGKKKTITEDVLSSISSRDHRFSHLSTLGV